MTIGDWLSINRSELPEGEAILLLSFALNREKAFLLAHPECPLSQNERALLDQFGERRRKFEPLSYITGEKEFFGLPFLVTRATLIPRPETEILVEYVLDRIKEQRTGNDGQGTKKISLIDIGTGSGCIPISIMATLREKNHELLPHIRCLAADISAEALVVAERNADHHGVLPFISFQKSDLLSDIPDSFFQAPSLILTGNLPYLSKEIYLSSPDDVRLYEPQSALQGDESDGTTLIIELLRQYIGKKTPSSSYFLILEISPEQGGFLLKQGKELFPRSETRLIPDLSGRNRFLIIRNRA